MKIKEREKTKSKSVICSGSVICSDEEDYSHPRIYLRIGDESTEVECPYCSKIFEFTTD